MAAPIAHIFLAVKVLAGPLSTKDAKQFIIGTSFPDIRYLEVISRDQTHFKNVEFKEILNEPSSFKAGLLFHSFVDEARDKFVKENNIMDLVPQTSFSVSCLKFVEDMALYPKFNIQDYIAYFDDVLEEQKAFLIKEERIKKWHQIIKHYLSSDPVLNYKESLGQMLSEMSFVKRMAFAIFKGKVFKLMKELIKNIEIQNKMLNFYLNFEEQLAVD